MYNFSKRFLDIVVSLLALIILIPILLPVVIILRFSAEGYVFYFQDRIGKYRVNFRIIKFATMLKDSPNLASGSITLSDDWRVTKPGKFLRKTKINELPQIINVLKGDISLVGPRPLVTKTFTAYNEEVQSKIYNVKPGLTGIASIIFRDEESIISAVTDEDPHEFYTRVIAPYKGELEIWYQSNRSFLLDLQLIFMTAWVIFFPKSNLIFKLFKDLPKKKDFQNEYL
jgi:lipopolysaccharide/colanic/teichoic acid biosynthesis glycosyltransferase